MVRTAPRGTVVSLTPLSLDADSRAFRIACSFAEAGFRSIVIEGEASGCRFWCDGIEAVALGPQRRGRSMQKTRRSGWSPALAMARKGQFGGFGELLLYTGFRGYDWWHYCRRPRAIIPTADLYYLHSFEFHRAVAEAATDHETPIIYDAHDFYRGIEPPEQQRSFDRNRLRPFLDRLEERLVASVDAIVTVSNGIGKLMERSFKRRPTIIRNCHDERLDQAIEPDLRSALGLSSTDRLCVVVGNRKPGMAVDTAMQALTMLPSHLHLAFVGRYYEADRDRFRGHPAAGRAHFGHYASPDQIVPFIRSADIGLIIYEGAYSENYRNALPNGFFQTVAAGLPIVRTALPEIEAAIDGHQVGISLEQLNAQDLADAIIRCAADIPSLRRASVRLAGELRWESEASRLHELVEGLLRSRVRSARPGEATA
jgi:glycosyltransferase involved in cell wall biosynthesis